MRISDFSGDMIFSKQELIDAAISMSSKSPNMNAHEVYSYLCYILGSHYWGYDYVWEE